MKPHVDYVIPAGVARIWLTQVLGKSAEEAARIIEAGEVFDFMGKAIASRTLPPAAALGIPPGPRPDGPGASRAPNGGSIEAWSIETGD